ncbi:MAG: hypothetical protein K2O32_05885 [Acetatifactor sp.]|nr:hypothetical protein [Acetatifactor sp.]
MAGISIPQYEVFKIGTNKLKYSDWNLEITKKEAFKFQELVSLFEAQEFRIMADRILMKDISEIDFSEIFMQVVIEQKSDFNRAACNKGITVNGINYRRFVGTTGGLKNNTLLFCNSQYIDELNELCECKRNKNIPLVPAKYEAYKALTCSASQPICIPDGILVVKDCVTQYFADVISLDDGKDSEEPVMETVLHKQLENTVSDGFNLCTIDYMKRVAEFLGLDYVPSGVCLRNAWLKGMLYPFPIVEFVEEFNHGNYFIEDIWGNTQDIRKCEMIITESSLKLWMAYDNIESYEKSYKECGYGFSVTKISPKVLEDQRELNYQYLQSYEFTDEDIEELCAPTIKYLKDAMGGDYASTVKFLGITENTEVNSWQRALYTSEYMLGDPYVIDSVHRFIKKKISDAKIGKLIAQGNYQIASGDPYALMQSICGLEVTGLLKAGECYSKFWIDKNEKEVVVFRSPMTNHNNIRMCKVNHDEECQRWYQYMDTIMIINAWDSFCIAENGCDWDSDILFSTNNAVLKRRYQELPAIECVQRNASKMIVTEKEVKKTNKNGMGNQVGTITNYVTSMMEVQSHFEKGSKEYKELEYRISCGQLYQQAELDKIKGIVATSMPSHWYNMRACADDRYLQSICAYRKPYFMIYVYEETKNEYKRYIKESNTKCQALYHCSIQDLYTNMDDLSDAQKEFLFWYEFKMPVGTGNCAMNKICRYVESQLDDYQSQLHKNSLFDYTVLKTKRRCTAEHRQALKKLEQYYCECLREYKKQKKHDKGDSNKNRNYLYRKFHQKAKEICPNEEERLNIILDITYGEKGNKQFCWDCIGKNIIRRLEEWNAVSTE